MFAVLSYRVSIGECASSYRMSMGYGHSRGIRRRGRCSTLRAAPNNGVIGNRPKQVEARGHRRRRDCKMTALLYAHGNHGIGSPANSLRRLHDSKPGKMRLGPDAWRRKVPSMSPMEKQFPVGRSGFAISRRESGVIRSVTLDSWMTIESNSSISFEERN